MSQPSINARILNFPKVQRTEEVPEILAENSLIRIAECLYRIKSLYTLPLTINRDATDSSTPITATIGLSTVESGNKVHKRLFFGFHAFDTVEFDSWALIFNRTQKIVNPITQNAVENAKLGSSQYDFQIKNYAHSVAHDYYVDFERPILIDARQNLTIESNAVNSVDGSIAIDLYLADLEEVSKERGY